MNKVLVISFDHLRCGEPNKSYAISHFISYAKAQPNYGYDFTVDHLSIDMHSTIERSTDTILTDIMKKFDSRTYNVIAISAYVWNEFLINPLIDKIKSSGFKGLVALGGYQITYAEKAKLHGYYPKADVFFVGYTEHTFYDFISSKYTRQVYESNSVDFSNIPSPYISGYINVEKGQEKVRWETKRGCYYSCNFCAHKEISGGGVKKSVHIHHFDKLATELSFFKEKAVRKINVLDPLFNVGNTYLEVMRLICESGIKSQFTFQFRLENLPRNENELSRFLDYAKSINCVMEVGIQTLQQQEWKAIGRSNNILLIEKGLNIFQKSNIKCEASLIYGLPYQNVSTFKDSIIQLENLGCSSITAWPLMLLRGTSLFEAREKYQLIEEPLGEYKIPTVVSSESFNYDDWLEMKSIADSLMKNDRY